MSGACRIASDGLAAEIAMRGAELVRLTAGDGRELLWNGDPAWWPAHAPLLFPIVGEVPGDRVRIGGRSFELPRHGFARRMDFTLLERDDASCLLELRSGPETLARYPFAFVLRLAYAIAGNALTVTATVHNESDAAMPMSLGFHPALRWPLPGGAGRDACEICFEADEPAPVRRLAGGLLAPGALPSPVVDRRLRLADSLFEADAVIFDDLRSRSVTYGPVGAPALRIGFPGLPHLGIWSKPGAPFVCIEPWQGHAAPVGFAGELADKPGVVSLSPGGSRAFAMSIELIAA